MQSDNLFGRLALHYKLLTREQLNEALRQQSREGGARKIGAILIERGWLTEQRFQQLLKIQKEYQAKMASKEGEAPTTAPPEAATDVASPAPPKTPTSLVDQIPGDTDTTAETQPIAALSLASADVPRTIPEILTLAMKRQASDVHIHTGVPLRFRSMGEFEDIGTEPLDAGDAERLIRSLLDSGQEEALERAGQVDFAYTLEGIGRFRANAYRQQNGYDCVLRCIPLVPPSLTDLNLPLDLARFANFHQGMVLFTGPTSCGKSSTLAAVLHLVNEERPDHIVTVEDPIEFVHRPKSCVINQRQVGRDTVSFSRALRAALREDPDVIVVGELRDLETISLALTAAETGHLVLASLHTMNSINTINRLIGVFPPSQQAQIRTMVSESLRAVISQRLARRADGEGVVPALEVLVCNHAVSNLIRENKTFQIRSVLQTGAAEGMRFLDTSLKELLEDGVIDRDEACRLADEPKRFEA